ncbi:hypothetical protein H5V45_17175 [Nocardioides sp. KIGAM211]|uniref:Serine protease n=1 Tax=Nocardioides luti TaxID=2761101 RepID=A0A7X0RIT5_9ACTN|nr:trypsin-like peptidase domain-containing protein [Nocardioides luti]MBB6629062.1 hypothetical protein [Nocardioides luti]
MRPSTPAALLAALVLAVPVAASAAPATAAAASAPAAPVAHRDVRWAPADSATIHPGVQMFTKGAQCTANFVFTDAASRVYVGYAAHCAGTGTQSDTNGCRTGSRPLGTPVRFATGATAAGGGTTVGRGTLVYSSWTAMRRAGTTNANACDFNDLALVRVDADDVAKVNPSVPFWGGPVALAKSDPEAGAQVFSWGQSSLRPTTVLSPRTGVVLARGGGGWSHEVYTATPGIPGDSGSGFLDADGRALGTLSTIAIAPVAGANGVGDLARELAFARDRSGLDGLRLVPGTEAFSPVP